MFDNINKLNDGIKLEEGLVWIEILGYRRTFGVGRALKRMVKIGVLVASEAIQWLKPRGKSCVLLMLDFQKACDSVK